MLRGESSTLIPQAVSVTANVIANNLANDDANARRNEVVDRNNKERPRVPA